MHIFIEFYAILSYASKNVRFLCGIEFRIQQVVPGKRIYILNSNSELCQKKKK